MNSTNIDIRTLTKIPEKEFKQHFRDWMEQDDIARSLQAKLRKDLIANFNKTSLGVSHRLNLSPLLLALNTLAAEFLYAQNCHFTLSVFCTEIPYRNTLPDFESTHYFRFSEHEIYEILDALAIASCNFDMNTKQSICKDYSKKDNPSLLFVVLKNLLCKPTNSKEGQDQGVGQTLCDPLEKETTPMTQHNKIPETSKTTNDKLNSKVEYQSKNFRYLNKYLMVLSKKMKEMSVNLDVLQKKNQTSQTVKKSLRERKMENLNRNLGKISENLRQLSVSKRKNKRLSAVVAAVNTMAKQFERCLFNFDLLSKGLAKGGVEVGQKAYSDWIHEMRTTDNGKLFLDKIVDALRKTLHRERKKMETELAQRTQIQKEILKSKYRHKLAEEFSTKTDSYRQAKSNEFFEQKLDEFEAKHKELHLKIQEAEKRLTETSSAKIAHSDVIKDKVTQTTRNIEQPSKDVEIECKNLHEMVQNISEQERHVDHIVFDAKLRVQELEHESNQLDRSFRDYLERQRSDKNRIRENATSIWQSYALGKSFLTHPKTTPSSNHHLNALSQTNKRSVIIPDMKTTATDLNIPTISIDDAASISPPATLVFENPFLVAKRKVLSRSKMTIQNQSLPPPLSPQQMPDLPLITDTDSSEQENNCTRSKQNKQAPKVTRLIPNNTNDDKIRTKTPKPLPNKATDVSFRKLNRTTTTTNSAQLLLPELNIDEITLDGIELSPTTAKSSSVRSGDSTTNSSCTRGGVFKLKRQLFASNSGAGSSPSPSPSLSPSLASSSVQQMNGNDDNKEALLEINKHPIVVDALKESTEVGAQDKEIIKKSLESEAEGCLGSAAGGEGKPLETSGEVAAIPGSTQKKDFSI